MAGPATPIRNGICCVTGWRDVSITPFTPRPEDGAGSALVQSSSQTDRQIGVRRSTNPYDGRLSRNDYRQMIRCIRSVERQIGPVEVLLKFGGAGSGSRGLVARSGATGRRYLLRRVKAEWLIASAAELEREVREID